MGHRRLIAVIVATGVALSLAAVALAYTGATRPARGNWKIIAGGRGGFKVDHNRKSISGFHVKEPASAGCGTAEIRVVGTHKLHRISSAGYTNWILGRYSPGAEGQVAGAKVKVRQGNKTTTGLVRMIFGVLNNKGENEGSITFGNCAVYSLQFKK